MTHEYPKVFISYSHQNPEYEKHVLEFSNKLRSEGIDAIVDLYEESPAEGWPRWMENQIRDADFVLIINCKSYYDKCYANNIQGKGVSWEVNIAYQHIYDNNSHNEKFIPVCFDEEDFQYILTPLKPFSYYNINNKDSFDNLYWRLRGVAKRNKPPLGKLRPLKEKSQKSMFVSSPIDIEKWNKAGWAGMAYLFYPHAVPILGLIFKNYETGKSIFKEWQSHSENGFIDHFVALNFIIPPFSKGSWIYSDSDLNYGKGYFVHIGPNAEESKERAQNSGIFRENLLLATFSRYRWMPELNGSVNRETFMKMVDSGSRFYLIPLEVKDMSRPFSVDNINIDFDDAVSMRTTNFKKGRTIKNDDLCKTVLNKPERL